MRAGQVAGISLILNNWFLAMVVLFALAGLLSKLLLLFGAIVWHETAHAIAARALGLKVRELEILPFGGVARIDELNETEYGKDIFIAAAGPASSLLLAALLWLLVDRLPNWAEVLTFLLQVNIMLFLFNLIPALPLDGGRILRALLCRATDYSRATGIAVAMGQTIGAGLLVLASFSLILDGTLNITFIAAGVFLWLAARREGRAAGFRLMKMLSRKKELLTSRGLLPTVQYTALGHMTVKEVVGLFRPECYHIILVVDENLREQGRITESEMWQVLSAGGWQVKISTIVK